MATAGRREGVDAKIKEWELALERLRLWLANAPEPVHLNHHPQFVELYRRKEAAKSHWEAIRGVYRPAPEAVRRLEEAWASTECAWRDAQPLFAEMSPVR